MASQRSGKGGGLPESPEGRRAKDFGPGGSGGAEGSEQAMRSRGGSAARVAPRGSGELPVPAVDPGESSDNLGAQKTGRDERAMKTDPTNRERGTNAGVPS